MSRDPLRGPRGEPRQAVLVIHGIGEQRPMATLRSFVEAVWTTDGAIQHPYAGSARGAPLVWSKPDFVSQSYELRRLTTSRNRNGIYTDFFEFYWAHLITGVRLSAVLAWARVLLLRWPGETVPPLLRRWLPPLPRRLLGAWLLLVLCGLAAAALYASLPVLAPALPSALRLLSSLLLLPALSWALRDVLGDAARYLEPIPANIQARHAIRSAGVSLLEELHARGYERIVVVGHSLGSVVGYDILTHAFARQHTRHGAPPTPARTALGALESMLEACGPEGEGLDLSAFRRAQRAYARELRSNGGTWRVTDFVTLGSPLAHAEVLLARDKEELLTRQRERELPTCPPRLETSKGRRRLSFDLAYRTPSRTRRIFVPHHAALFALTRWTNLYFPARAVFFGDVVGGALRPAFGAGIKDVAVRTRRRLGLLAHTHYWSLAAGRPTEAVLRLREALDLLDEQDR